jgi:glycosyltransferase involved in cell wall biosynthesis
VNASPTLGLALIARDEEALLPGLLASIEGAFDQVVLLDTGSVDRTAETFEQWAARQDLPLGYVLDRFEWCDDFAAARNAADALLETDWLCWADCDDRIVGAEHLREAVARNPTVEGQPVAGFDAMYREVQQGATEQSGEPWWQQRLHPRGAARWVGRVHEHLRYADCDGLDHRDAERCLRLRPENVHWVHAPHPDHWQPSGERNRQVLRMWVEAEPRNLRPLGMLAATEAQAGQFGEAIELLDRYLELSFPPPLSRRDHAEHRRALWALGTLQRAYRAHVSERELRNLAECLLAIILTREPPAWWSTGPFAEDERNPEPAHLEPLAAEAA